jgi:hypothetical protein
MSHLHLWLSDMKPQGPCFDREWRTSCEVRRVNRRKADDMVKAHYIGRWPAEVSLTLGLYRGSKLLGVMTFSEVKRALADRFGAQTWELSRLWIKDKVPTNAESFFIGRAIRLLKRERPELRMLISFADPEAGHSGVIYRASNWTPVEHGTKELFEYPLCK